MVKYGNHCASIADCIADSCKRHCGIHVKVRTQPTTLPIHLCFDDTVKCSFWLVLPVKQ
jgi:hypothetical protein